jgi:hypothetical protein
MAESNPASPASKVGRLSIPWDVPTIVPEDRDHEYRRAVVDYLAAPHCLSSAACKARVLADMGLVPAETPAPPAEAPAEAVLEDKPEIVDPTPFPPARRPDGTFGLPQEGDEG